MKHVGASLIVLLAGGCSTASVVPRGPVPIPLPSPPRPVEELTRQLGAPDAPSRAAAAWFLAGAGEVDAATVEALRTALDDPSAPVREAATWALWHVKSPGLDTKELMESPPRLLVQTKPVYPRAPYEQKIEGTVLVEFLVNEVGRVSHAEIRTSVPGFDEAALACVRDWQFEPAKRRGRPVACVAQSPVTFRIH